MKRHSDNIYPPNQLINSLAKHCSCCPYCWSRPCDGLLAGGYCDDMQCNCDVQLDYDDYIEDHDYE